MWFCLHSFAFTICPRVLPVRFLCLFVFVCFSIVFSTCYHWWICFWVWLLSSFFFFPFLYYFLIFLILIIIFYFNNSILFHFFLSFFLFFSLLFWVVWLTGSWCSSQVSGLCLWGGRAEFRTLVQQSPPGSSWYQTANGLPEISISMLRPSSAQWPASYSTEPLCQTTSKRGTQPHPLTERPPNIIIRSQTPQNTPLDVILPPRGRRSSLIHQNTGTTPLHQGAYTTHCTNLSHGGRHQKQQEQRTCSLQKGDPKHSKLSKMRRQRNTQQMKEQGKKPPDQIKRK